MAGYTELDLETLDKKTQKPPECRVKDAASARMNFQQMLAADSNSASKRAEVQAMLDGKPPLDQAVLIAKGQGSRTNLNFGDAKRIHSAAVDSMIDLVNSLEYVVRVPLKYGVVTDPEERKRYEEMLACEVTRTFRNWGNWDANFQTVASKWIAHGVGIAYYDNNYDWRWEATGLGDFLFPRKTKASEEHVSLASCRRGYKLEELWGKIRNETAAKTSGWNVDIVKKAILKCATTVSDYSSWSWERLQEELANSDYAVGVRCPEVKLVHEWVKEFDGSVTMLIFVEDESQEPFNKEFLYKKQQAFEEMRRAFITFCFGVGNGYYHGITGLMRDLYPHIQTSNRLRSVMVDAAVVSSSIMLQPESETALDKMAMVSFGPYTMLPPADVAKFVARTSPNLSQNVTPVLADMQNSLDQRAGQLGTDSPLSGGAEKTRFEVEALVARNARVGTAQLNLFYPPASRLVRESTRRLCAPDYSASKPGGKEAEEFRRRLQDKGFPIELLTQIDFDEVSFPRALGAGSESAQIAAFNIIEPLVPAMDAVGKHNFYRDKSAMATRDYTIVDRYFPPLPGDVRPPQDKQIAELENAVMALLQDVPVQVNQMHQVHLDTHLPVLDEYLRKVQMGEMDEMEALDPMAIIHAHCIQHLEPIQGDPMLQDAVGVYRQALSNASEILWNATKERQAMEAKAAEQGQGQGDANGAAVAQEAQAKAEAERTKLVMKIAESRAKLQLMKEKSETEQAIRVAKASQEMELQARKAQQDRNLADAKNAGEMLNKARQAAMKPKPSPKRPS